LIPDIKVRTLTEGFEKRALRRKFGSKRDEVVGCWKKTP
jgi:hypothetical protein